MLVQLKTIHRKNRQNQNSTHQIFLVYNDFMPTKILAILYICFISIFAFDVFGEGYSFFETIVALFMHLLPSFALIACLLVAWKKEVLGGTLFLLLAILFTVFFKTYQHLVSFVLISVPVFFIGFLFIINKYIKQ